MTEADRMRSKRRATVSEATLASLFLRRGWKAFRTSRCPERPRFQRHTRAVDKAQQ